MEFFRRFGPSWWLRLAGLGVMDAVVVALIPSLIDQGANVALASILLGAAGINYIFLSARTYALRWLVPGLVFLTLLMLWPIIFTVFIALTNWSNGNFITKPQAIERITLGSTYLLDTEDAPIVEMFLYRDPELEDATDPTADLKMLIRTDEGEVFFGPPRLASGEPPEESTLEDLADFTVVDDDGDGIPEEIDGFRKLLLRDISTVNDVIDQLVLDIPERGQARSRTFSSATLAIQRFAYDKQDDVLIDALKDSTCTPVEGSFVCAGSERIDPGWREVIGFDNFSSFVTDERVRTPFLRIFAWNLVFAILVVLLQFAVGLALALTFQDIRMKGRMVYRALLIIPYAAPGFITVIVWRGLLNQTFGPVNRLIDPLVSLFTEARIPWVPPASGEFLGLEQWFWAKAAVILVTLWQGFPYFFLITTGALQSIPSDLQEAARTDGATARQVFRRITFPLLMVSVAPLLIASFAFNFNNFVNVFLLTQGGPPVTGYGVPFGETDILISFTFNLALESGRGGQFALAAASTFFIFFLVATISAISFRFTKRLETIYGNL